MVTIKLMSIFVPIFIAIFLALAQTNDFLTQLQTYLNDRSSEALNHANCLMLWEHNLFL